MGADRFNVDCSYSRGSGYLTHAETLADAVAKARWAIEFYDPMYPGTVRVSISVACPKCDGRGRIGKGRKGVRFPKYVDCPECKAQGCFPVPAVI